MNRTKFLVLLILSGVVAGIVTAWLAMLYNDTHGHVSPANFRGYALVIGGAAAVVVVFVIIAIDDTLARERARKATKAAKQAQV